MARTRISNIARTFKPNTASLGYALFLAINAAGVWGGVFPIFTHELPNPGSHVLVLLDAIARVLAMLPCQRHRSVLLSPGPRGRFLVNARQPSPYRLGWRCLAAAIYVDAHRASRWCSPSGWLLGLGVGRVLHVLWQRLFASLDADRGNHDLMLGTAYGALLYFALYAIPQAVTAFLIPLVFMPLFALAIVLKSRQIDLRQPMFEDVPREHPQVYRRVLRDYWRSALCVGAIAFCTGVMRSLAIGRSAGRQPCEPAVHDRMPGCRRRRFGAVAVQERPHERDQRLPRRLPDAHHLVSGASVFQRRLRSMAGRYPVCGL